MSWWRPDSSYDVARPRLATSGAVMSTPYTRAELDAAHDSGAAVVVRAGPGGAQVQIELDRDEVIELARRWLEGQGVEDVSPGGWLSSTAEDLAQTRVVQALGAAAGAGSLDADGAGASAVAWVKVGVVLVGVLAVAWGLASVASIARAVRG